MGGRFAWRSFSQKDSKMFTVFSVMVALDTTKGASCIFSSYALAYYTRFLRLFLKQTLET